MIIEFLPTNQINRVHWEYSLRRINARIESLPTSEEKVIFLLNLSKALKMNNISNFDCFVEATGHFDDQTQDSVYDFIQAEINNIREQSYLKIVKTKQASFPEYKIIGRKQIDIDVVKSLFEKLKDYFTPYDYDSFLYVINGGEKPSGFTGLTWLRSKALLAYFVDKLHCELINKKPDDRTKWKSFENDFQVPNLRVSKSDWQKDGKCPIGSKDIDAMFEIVKT